MFDYSCFLISFDDVKEDFGGFFPQHSIFKIVPEKCRYI